MKKGLVLIGCLLALLAGAATRDVFPPVPANNKPNTTESYMEHFSERIQCVISGCIESPDFSYFFPGQLGGFISLATHSNFAGKASFSNGISCVRKLVSKPEVGGVDTGSIVTSGAIMENIQTVRDCAKMENPTPAMRENISLATFGDAPIAVLPDAASPYPARIGESNFIKESCGEPPGKTFRLQELDANVTLHNRNHVFRCATSPGSPERGRHFFRLLHP